MKKLLFLISTLAFGQALPPIPNAQVQYFDANGLPVSGGLLATCVAGLTCTVAATNPLATYTDSAGGTPNTNPVVLSVSGRASVYLTNACYKFELYTALGVLIWSQDHVCPSAVSAGTANANTVLAGPTSGGAAAMAPRLLVSADIPSNAANTSGTAALATALASAPTQCSSGQAARGVAVSGNAANCFQPTMAGLVAGLVPATSTVNFIQAVDLMRTLCDNVTPVIGVSHPTANPSASTCYTGSNTQRGAELFSATSQTFQVSTVLPDDWVTGSGNDVVIYFADITDTNTGHNEVFNVSTACTAVAATLDPAFNTAQLPTVAVATGGVAGVANTATLSGWTTTGCAAGRLMWLKIGLDATRTATGNAAVAQVRLKQRVTKVAQ